ncbi:MAG: hypothetical protein ACT4QD_21325 [Acidobacteriota bacterium]
MSFISDSPDASGRRYALAIVAGVLGAAAYTLWPLTLWTLTGATALIWAAGRGLPASERRALGLLMASAFAVRVLLVAAIFLSSEYDSQAAAILFGDEAYTLSRTLRIRNVLFGIPALKYDYIIAFEDYGRTSYLWVVTAAQMVFGPSPFGLRLLNALFFLTGAVLLFRVARRSFGALPAFLGLTLLLFLPTWLFWSVSLLKESLYFLLAALILAALVAAIRGVGVLGPAAGMPPWLRRSVLVLTAAVALYALRDLRSGAVTLILSGLGTGLLLTLISTSARRFVGATAAAVIIAAVLLTRPGVRGQIETGLQAAAQAHIGHVLTVGHPYKLLDDGFYVQPDLEPRPTPAEAARFALRAIVSFFVVPLPSQVVTRGEMAQLPEHVLWLVMIVLCPFGIAAGLRRQRLWTGLLIGYVLPTAVVVALTNGNVGTLVRFRGLVTPYLVWLACLGLCVIMQRLIVLAREWDTTSARWRSANEQI